MAKNNVRIKLKAYEHRSLDAATEKIVKAAEDGGVKKVIGPIPLPTEKQIVTVLRSVHVNKDSREQFDFYANNLENLHRYNLHKYMGCSPAIHFDLWDSSVKNGWEGYYDRFKKIMDK